MTQPGTAPPPNDLDRLLGAAVEAATRLLSADGEFYPFAVAMTADGEVVSPSVDPPSDHPTSVTGESTSASAPSIAAASVGRSYGATGADQPWPGRSTTCAR